MFAEEFECGCPVRTMRRWGREVEGEQCVVDGGFLSVRDRFVGLSLGLGVGRCEGDVGGEEDRVAVSVRVSRASRARFEEDTYSSAFV